VADLLTEVVPLALGAAIAPTILTLELLALGTDVATKRRGWAMAIGYLAGLLAWAFVSLPPSPTSRPSSASAPW